MNITAGDLYGEIFLVALIIATWYVSFLLKRREDADKTEIRKVNDKIDALIDSVNKLVTTKANKDKKEKAST